MNIVLGARGRLGHAIASSFPAGQVHAPERADYADWSAEDGAARAARYLEHWAGTHSVVYVAAGIIEPARPPSEHEQVNFRLPAHVIEAAAPLGLRVVTFGTVMESFVRSDGGSAYVRSKAALGRFAQQRADRGDDVLHARIHTLFGGARRPDPFMFLGQILDALSARAPFRMSSGRQLREYHQLDDEVAAIRAVVDASVRGTLDLSHGEPVRLRELAEYIFDAFACPHLLEVGALADPVQDNFAVTYERPAVLRAIAFRDARPAVVQYLRSFETSHERVD